MFKKKEGWAIRGTIGSCPQVPVILKSVSDPMLCATFTKRFALFDLLKSFIPIPRSCQNIFRLCRKDYKRWMYKIRCQQKCQNIFLSMCDVKVSLTFTSLSLVLLLQLFYLFCSSIVINTVIVTAGNFEP